MSRRRLSSANLTTIIVAITATIGTIVTAYFAFRGNTAPVELPLAATQTAHAQIAATHIPIENTATIIPDTAAPTAAETLHPTLSSTIDVPDPLGTDVLEFAATVNFNVEPKGSFQMIGGIWNSEWNREGGPLYSGIATILVYTDNWITIVYQGDDGGQFLIKAKLVSNKLLGRYINLHSESDTTPWVGILVDDNRIDGKWKGGTWNFTRNP